MRRRRHRTRAGARRRGARPAAPGRRRSDRRASWTRAADRPRPGVVGSTRQALVVASRAEFDGRLLAAAERAGATLRRVAGQGRRRRPLRRPPRARSRVARASRLIGADGANSLVRRRLAQPFTRDQLSIATGFFAHGVTSDEIVVEMDGRPARVSSGRFRGRRTSPSASARRPTRAIDGRRAARARGRVDSRHAASRAGARLEPYSWPIPSLERATTSVALVLAGPRWCLVGDAAGLVDPITREGIYFALLSGQWAADAAHAARPWTRYAEQVRDDDRPGARAPRRACKRRVLPPAVHGAAGRGARTQRRGARGDGGSRRRPAELRQPALAAAEDVRDRTGVAAAADRPPLVSLFRTL